MAIAKSRLSANGAKYRGLHSIQATSSTLSFFLLDYYGNWVFLNFNAKKYSICIIHLTLIGYNIVRKRSSRINKTLNKRLQLDLAEARPPSRRVMWPSF